MRSFVIVVLSLLAGIFVSRADEPAADSASAELLELGKLVEAAAATQQQALAAVDVKADFNAFIETNRKSSPMTLAGERLIAFAEQHAGTPEAIFALAHVLVFADGDPDDPAYHFAEEAIELLGRNELHNESFAAAAEELVASISPRAERTLRRVSQHSNHRLTRAAATQALVELLHALSQQARTLDEEPSGRNRDWVKQSYRPAVRKKLGNRKPEELIKEAIQLAERVRKEYGDAKQAYRRSGPSGIVRKPIEPEKRQTYGDLADSFLFEMRNLQVGHQAPDIVGKDTGDREFRLSDYRNKVVVLTFSADWCRPCVAEYLNQRKLVENYKDRPFALLSVVADEEPRTVDEAIANGDITWRCWYDGFDGPIALRWNIRSRPTVFVLDAQGIIRHYQPNDKQLPDLVEVLVRKAEQGRD